MIMTCYYQIILFPFKYPVIKTLYTYTAYYLGENSHILCSSSFQDGIKEDLRLNLKG